jgi:hypothetical protein
MLEIEHLSKPINNLMIIFNIKKKNGKRIKSIILTTILIPTQRILRESNDLFRFISFFFISFINNLIFK